MTRRSSQLLAMGLAALIAGALAAPGGARADPVRDAEWWLGPLRIGESHSITRGEGVVVGLIDTGVDETRPELRGRLLPGKGYAAGDPPNGWDSSAEAAHGTGIAGIIAGQAPKENGFIGVAPGAKILPFATNVTVPGAVPAGLRWLTDQGAKVVNIARGSLSQPTPEEISAVQYAVSRDVVVVASAGNRQGGDDVANPARIPGVVAVSSADRVGDFSNASSYGPEVVLAAPGVEIAAPAPLSKSRTGYSIPTGTSPATAIVSGVAALVRARYPDMSAANVIERLIRTARDKGDPGRDPYYGFGTVRPYQALTESVPEVKDSSLGAPPAATAPAAQQPPGKVTSTGSTEILGLRPSRWAFIVVVAAVAILLIVLISRKRQPATPLGFQSPQQTPQAARSWPPPPGPAQQGPPPHGPPPQGPPPPSPPPQSGGTPERQWH